MKGTNRIFILYQISSEREENHYLTAGYADLPTVEICNYMIEAQKIFRNVFSVKKSIKRCIKNVGFVASRKISKMANFVLNFFYLG